MQIQYTCGWRQVTDIWPDRPHPNERLELKPGEKVSTKLLLAPATCEAFVIDSKSPVEVASGGATLSLSKPLIWQRGNGITCPFGEAPEAAPLDISNPSATETITVLIVSIDDKVKQPA